MNNKLIIVSWNLTCDALFFINLVPWALKPLIGLMMCQMICFMLLLPLWPFYLKWFWFSHLKGNQLFTNSVSVNSLNVSLVAQAEIIFFKSWYIKRKICSYESEGKVYFVNGKSKVKILASWFMLWFRPVNCMIYVATWQTWEYVYTVHQKKM